jgi:hypothetical protein
MNDERLGELYRKALAQGSAASGPRGASCVTPEQVLALARGEGSEQSRLGTLDHVMACPSCRREFDLLRAVEQAGVDSGARRPRVRWQWQSIAPIGLAASLLLALGVAIGVNRAGESPDLPRGTTGGVTLLAPAAQVAANEPLRFVWRPVRHANRYVLEVLDGSGGGKPVLSRETSDTALVLDPTLLQPGTGYQWWVRAVTPAGEVASPFRPVRLRSR